MVSSTQNKFGTIRSKAMWGAVWGLIAMSTIFIPAIQSFAIIALFVLAGIAVFEIIRAIVGLTLGRSAERAFEYSELEVLPENEPMPPKIRAAFWSGFLVPFLPIIAIKYWILN